MLYPHRFTRYALADTKPVIDLTSLLSRAASALGERVGALPNVLSKRSKELRPRIAGAKKTPGVCPYCAVGCGTTVYSKDGTIVDIEGNPDSPINAGTLCPKGAATFQLHVNPNRLTAVKYRAPFASEWTDVPHEWAMQRIAERIKDTRDRTFREHDEHGRRVNRTTAIASLGGATLDNEENYLIGKLFRNIGTPFIENQARI
jgi:formate dehydrogenase major subunit